MAKEYGKLTAHEFRRFVEKLPEVRECERESRVIASRMTNDEVRRLLSSDGDWSLVYELPYTQHIALVFLALDGGKDLLAEIAADDNPQSRLLAEMEADRLEFDADTYKGGHEGRFTAHELFGLFFSLQRTILSVMLYQRTLSGLVQEVREDGNLDSLFSAVRIDRTTVACPSIAARICRAEFRNDKRFFIHLRNALKGPQQKHWERYKDLRYSLFMLRELGFDKLSDDELERLLVHTLKVYPDVPGARKNLRRQYQESKKIKTI